MLDFENDGKIVENAKLSVLDDEVLWELLELERKYFFILDLIENAESVSYSVEKAIKDVNEIKIVDDICNINDYISARKSTNDIFTIPLMPNKNLTPSTYACILKSQATSISVERSFSMLNKLNAKDRNFKDENFHKYIILHYNLLEINE